MDKHHHSDHKIQNTVNNQSGRNHKREWNDNVKPNAKNGFGTSTQNEDQLKLKRTKDSNPRKDSNSKIKRNSKQNTSQLRKEMAINNSKIAIAQFKSQLKGLSDQLNIQKQKNQHLSYTEKVKNMLNLKEAHEEAISTILSFAQTAQRIVQHNQSNSSFRKELSSLIQQLAIYCAQVELNVTNTSSFIDLSYEQNRPSNILKSNNDFSVNTSTKVNSDHHLSAMIKSNIDMLTEFILKNILKDTIYCLSDLESSQPMGFTSNSLVANYQIEHKPLDSRNSPPKTIPKPTFNESTTLPNFRDLNIPEEKKKIEQIVEFKSKNQQELKVQQDHQYEQQLSDVQKMIMNIQLQSSQVQEKEIETS